MPVKYCYYKLNHILLKVLGLWPHEDSYWTYIPVLMVTCMYLSAIFVQLAVFVTHKCTWDITIDVLSLTLPSVLSFFMYDVYYFNSDLIKKIMDHMYYDWMSFKYKAEHEIVNNYVSIIKWLTEIYVYCTSMAMLFIGMTQVVPITLDVFFPLNEPRAHLLFVVEYFMDPIKYSYLFAFHIGAFIFLATTVLIIVGIEFLSYCFHVCAMFEIVSYRMKLVMDEDILQIHNPKTEHAVCKRIAHAVSVHQRAILYIRLLLSSIGVPFFLAIIMIVISLSICFFRFSKTVILFVDFNEVFMTTNLFIGHLCFIFLGNYLGQLVTNCNAGVFVAVYNMPWYRAPVNIQKLLLFILQRGNKDIYLTTAGIFNASYEGLTTLLMSSISYFTVIYTLQ